MGYISYTSSISRAGREHANIATQQVKYTDGDTPARTTYQVYMPQRQSFRDRSVCVEIERVGITAARSQL